MYNFCHIEIPTNDLEASKRFYGEVFGWKMTYDAAMDYLMFEPDEGPGGGFYKVDYVGVGAVIVYVKVPSIDEAMRRIIANGGSEVTPKTSLGEMGWYAVFRDPVGVKIGLWETAAKAAGEAAAAKAPRARAKAARARAVKAKKVAPKRPASKKAAAKAKKKTPGQKPPAKKKPTAKVKKPARRKR